MKYNQIAILHGQIKNISDCVTSILDNTRKVYQRNYKRISLICDDNSHFRNKLRSIIVNESDYHLITACSIESYAYFICNCTDDKGTKILNAVALSVSELDEKFKSFMYKMYIDEDKRLEKQFEQIEKNKQLHEEYLQANEQYREIYGIKEEDIEEYPF